MLATAVWLASLITERYGERAWWLGIFLVFVGIAAWIFGEFIQRGQQRKGLAAAILLGVLALAYFWVLDGQLQWRRPLNPATAAEAPLKNSPERLCVAAVESRGRQPGARRRPECDHRFHRQMVHHLQLDCETGLGTPEPSSRN